MRGLAREYAGIFSASMRVLDILLLVAAALLAHRLRFGDSFLPAEYQTLVITTGLLAILLFDKYSLYSSWRGVALTKEIGALTLALVSVGIGMLVILVATKTAHHYSRQWLVVWFGLAWGLLLAFRISLRWSLRRLRASGGNSRNVVFVGPRHLSQAAARRITASRSAGLRVIGYFDAGYFDDWPVTDTDTDPFLLPRLGDLASIPGYLAKHRIDQVWLTLPLRAEYTLKQVLYSLRHSTVDIRFVPDLFGFRILNQSVSEVAGLPVVNLSLSPMTGLNRLVKALEDRLLALAILVLISPLMLVIAVAIKLSSPGPVLFRQLRHGWDGEVIEIYKFRTMKLHSEPPGQVVQARANDPRIYPLGAFLRRTSLDELPQFINVLQGRMAIVGPRPHALQHNEEFKDRVDRYMLRHKVKPGITGWAQVNGLRGEVNALDTMQKRIEYDLYYIENWSVWFDLRIILLTLVRGFSDPHAY